MPASQDVGGYQKTIPRGPIAAMYSSPGPCYGLPGLVGQVNHDARSVHFRAPAYAFGVRHGKFKDDCSPGPRYLPQAKCYRDGLDGTPHYSLYSRNPDLKSFKTPGPGAYKAEENGPNTKYSPPQYSFGIRHRSRRTDNTPGPNCYSLPNMLGRTVNSDKTQAPNYSLVGRRKIGGFHEDLSKTPGPGAYDTPGSNLYRNAPPAYSMTARHALPGDNTRKPGPGAHSPQSAGWNKRAAPMFSFGIRHSPYITNPLIMGCDD